MTESHNEFHPQREQQSDDYQALSPLDQPRIHIRFDGHFQGRQIIWDADLRTLKYEHEQTTTEKQPGGPLHQYIHIHPADGERIPITVAFNVPQFDEPTILKTMIMIHNYKRLRLGRHEFGPPVCFSD